MNDNQNLTKMCSNHRQEHPVIEFNRICKLSARHGKCNNPLYAHKGGHSKGDVCSCNTTCNTSAEKHRIRYKKRHRNNEKEEKEKEDTFYIDPEMPSLVLAGRVMPPLIDRPSSYIEYNSDDDTFYVNPNGPPPVPPPRRDRIPPTDYLRKIKFINNYNFSSPLSIPPERTVPPLFKYLDSET